MKKKGIQKLSIKDVMEKAHLTRGSFYIYFKNKADMVLRAFKWSVGRSNEGIKNYINHNAKDKDNTYTDFMEFYLSSLHRDEVGAGVPIAALAKDFGREDLGKPREFAKMLSFLFEEKRALLKRERKTITREECIGITSTYIGTLILSRACKDTELSEEILKSSKKYLLK